MLVPLVPFKIMKWFSLRFMNLRMETEAYLPIKNAALLTNSFHVGPLIIIIKYVRSKRAKAKDPQTQ